jgi:hypothetical protein
MGWIDTVTNKLSKQLYPNSNAFNYVEGGILSRLIKALNLSYGRAYNGSASIYDSMIPHNSNFTSEDADILEANYGIYSTAGTSLADRKLAIRFKMGYPINDEPRCNHEYITASLQAAGFNVKVYENRFWVGSPATLETEMPQTILGLPAAGEAMLGAFQLGQVELAGKWIDNGITLAVNYLEEAEDAMFAIGSNYRNTFYVADPSNIITFATIPISRRTEFRQLLLSLKPAQTVGLLFISYI